MTWLESVPGFLLGWDIFREEEWERVGGRSSTFARYRG